MFCRRKCPVFRLFLQEPIRAKAYWTRGFLPLAQKTTNGMILRLIAFLVKYHPTTSHVSASAVWLISPNVKPGPAISQFHLPLPSGFSFKSASTKSSFPVDRDGASLPAMQSPQSRIHPCFIITDLIHHINRVSTVVINRLKQGYRILNGIQRKTTSSFGTFSASEISNIVGSREFLFVRLSRT